MSPTPNYKNPTSTQTLQTGLDEYYRVNPHITDPTTQPREFAKILIAHDVGHVIYGCDTGMHDELKLLPLSWWTSECTFKAYLGMKNTPAVDVMYDDMIRDKGAFWLYISVIKVVPILIPELILIWFKSRHRKNRVPFLEFHPLLDRQLIDIRREFDLLPLMR